MYVTDTPEPPRSRRHPEEGLPLDALASQVGDRQDRQRPPVALRERERRARAQTERATEGGLNLAFISNGDWVRVKGVGFGSGAASFSGRSRRAGR